MRVKRFGSVMVLAGLLGGPAAAQTGYPTPAPRPTTTATIYQPGGYGYAPGVIPAAQATPVPPLPAGVTDPTAVLTGQPAVPAGPTGVVNSPWCGGSPAGAGLCGPTGGNGPVGYDFYLTTGPTLVVGGSPELSGALDHGWYVGGGGRTLLFNQAGDAAWALDLGLGYSHVNGNDSRVIDVFTPRVDANNNNELLPEIVASYRVRALHRTTFNFAVGRDWFLNGPGNLGSESGWNSRVGVDVGGQWGTGHIDLIPVADTTGYLRRSGITHGFTAAAHYDWCCPMGSWIWFGGLRAQWGYQWMNYVPPQDGNLQDVTLTFRLGVRF